LGTLRDQYQGRVQRLDTLLRGMEEVEPDKEDPIQEVWSMTGAAAVENRTKQLIDGTTDEVVLVIGHASLLTEDLIDCLNSIGTVST